jgi:16S rRNA (guanine527-N7)-methyltransferase
VSSSVTNERIPRDSASSVDSACGAFSRRALSAFAFSTRQTTIKARMSPARIAELLAPFLADDPSSSEPVSGLTVDDLSHISTYINILLRWNARINLTAIRDPDEIVTRHFGESLFAARRLFPTRSVPGAVVSRSGASGAGITPPKATGVGGGGAALQACPERSRRGRVGTGENRALAPESVTVADLGSGAGFPGIPIKLWAPQLSLTLIESNQKKVAFLHEVARALTLTDINIQDARAETLPPASFDVVTLRAVEHFETVLLIAATLVAPAGRLALLVSATQVPLAKALLLSHTWSEPYPIPNSRSRILLIARPDS